MRNGTAMVARDPHEMAATPLRAFARAASALFESWRRLLTRTLRASSNALRSAARRLRPTVWPSDPLGRERVAARVGPVAFGIGLVMTVVVTVSQGEPLRSGLARAVTMTLWALARLAILVALSDRDPRARQTAQAAWSISLVPFAMGATPALRVLALAAGATLAHVALRSRGVPSSRATGMVLWAFGGQLAVTATALIVLGSVVLVAW